MAAASGLTLAVIAIVGGVASRLGAPAAPKTPVHAQQQPAPSDEDARAAEFIQNFALAHVSPPLPESALADPDQTSIPVLPPQREAVAVEQMARTKPPLRPPFAKAPLVKPPARPMDVVQAVPSGSVPPAQKPAGGFRIPFVSDVAAKIPSGRDIMDGVGSVGRKIGSIFGRS